MTSKEHMLTVHGSDGIKFHCTVGWCEWSGVKFFTRKDHLKRHKKKVHKL